MFNVGPLELIVVLIVALIVLGPQRLPDVARSLGRGMREFRSALDRPDEDDDEYKQDDLEHEGETEDEGEPGAEAEPEPEPKPGDDAEPGDDYQKAAESSESSSSSSGRV